MKLAKLNNNKPEYTKSIFDCLERIKNKYNMSEADCNDMFGHIADLEYTIKTNNEELEFRVHEIKFEPAFNKCRLDISIYNNLLNYIIIYDIGVSYSDHLGIDIFLPTLYDNTRSPTNYLSIGNWENIKKFIFSFITNNPHMLSLVKMREKGIEYEARGIPDTSNL